MSSFAIKIAAMVSMLAEYAGCRFEYEMPQAAYLLCRTAGSLAMPLFCFLIAEGLLHTRDVRKYLLRLTVFAVASEVPFDLCNSGTALDWSRQNPGFTLLLGLLGILLFDSFAAQGRNGAALAAVLAAALFATFIYADFQGFGVYFVFIFYRFRGNFRALSLTLGAGLLCLAAYIWMASGLIARPEAFVSVAGMAALLLIRAYSGRRGPDGLPVRLAMYAFYPVMLVSLYAAWMMMFPA